MDVAGLGLILLKQVLFFVAAAVVVVWVAPALMTLAGVLKAPSGIAVMAVIICLAMAWASNLAGLSYAVGAFFAGIAVSNSDYAEDADRYIEPVGGTLFVPVFFVGIGLQTTGVDDTKMIVFIAIMTVLRRDHEGRRLRFGWPHGRFWQRFGADDRRGHGTAWRDGVDYRANRLQRACARQRILFDDHLHHFAGDAGRAAATEALTIRKVPGVGAGAAGTAGAGRQ